jgi:hypothetical protein
MLIGVGGHAGSGKDAVARIIARNLGYYNAGSFSIGLNECLLVMNPIVGYDAGYERYADIFARFGYDAYDAFKAIPEVRRLLQVFGTDVGRNMIDNDVWVRVKEREVREQLKLRPGVVVTSIRYPNELGMLTVLDGRGIWVNRPGYGPINEHSSDNSLTPDVFDAIVQNDGTLDDLERAVGEAIRSFK